MLNSLLEMESAFKLLKQPSDKPLSSADLTNFYYDKLKCDMKRLNNDSEEYAQILDYVNNGHAPTHPYKLSVEEVIELSREGEEDRFKKLHNRHLLWHGSRTTNFVGILSKGLKIAPPEAPTTGE